MKVEEFYQKYFREGNITTDTRKISPGDIFIALKGESFNGNHFAGDAIRAGAAVAVVDEDIADSDLPVVKVSNSLTFLQELANYHRKTRNFTVVAITGTNGKTTTKELIYSVLSQQFKTQATVGNLNNHIGVPLTLLSIKHDTEIAVIEMGANHVGEIKALCAIAEPEFGLITNIGKAHLEGFGGFEGVKKAKSELYDYLKENGGTLFINGTDKILTSLAGSYDMQIPYDVPNNLRAVILKTIPTLEVEITSTTGDICLIQSNLFGEYNKTNILAAAAVARNFGMGLDKIKVGIEAYLPENHRSQILEIGNTQLIMDCYNANPTSMSLAIREFARMPKEKKIAILGGMKELGEVSAPEHKNIVQLLEESAIQTCILIGSEFGRLQTKDMYNFEDAEKASALIAELDLANAVILLKGSRANRLEQLQEVISENIRKSIN